MSDEFWDDFYRAGDRIWSGNPNDTLVREATELAPGRALDLGCGEGADAIWLAGHGWQVTATDISQVALDRAGEHAASAGVGDRIDWQRHDLGVSFPAGEFDLVSVHFLHSPVELLGEQILRAAAAAVAPKGVLLIVGHAMPAPGEHHPHPDMRFPSPDEILTALDLPDGQWELLLGEVYEHTMTGRDGRPADRRDNVLKLQRLAH
jgi:SAM-dependent methyltransferase